MKLIFSIIFMLTAGGLFATAPLDGGFSGAPKASASQEERDRAFFEARNKVINTSEKYLNTPYRYGGITSKGLDCSGLIYLSFKDAVGVSLPRSASSLYSWTEKIPFDKAQPGDLLFFKTDNSGRITHVAIYLGARRFIHSASHGAKTGVINTSLDEGSWSRTFAGAGRAFPEISKDFKQPVTAASAPLNPLSEKSFNEQRAPSVQNVSSTWRFYYGAAFAPTWNAFLKDGNFLRGFTSQFRLSAGSRFFGAQMLFGLELRPEYDGALGVFRLPLSLSWGLNDKYRIFAGPVLSIGSASLSTAEGERHYSQGTTWFGTLGITAAPFILSTSKGDFAPYAEAAWQSYSNNNSDSNLNADFSANFRFSTGLRWTMQILK